MTKTFLISLTVFLIAYCLGVNKQISYTLPPAFPCHATAENPCQDFYLYKTNYKEAFNNTMAVLQFRTAGE